MFLTLQEFGVPFMETSARSGLNVELAFTAVAKWVQSSLKGFETGLSSEMLRHSYPFNHNNNLVHIKNKTICINSPYNNKPGSLETFYYFKTLTDKHHQQPFMTINTHLKHCNRILLLVCCIINELRCYFLCLL